MKNVFALCLFLLSTAAQADSLLCTEVQPSGYFRNRSEGRNHHLVITETIRGDCDDGYSFEISGFGPGLRVGNAAISINCPFVEDFRGIYAGVKFGGGAALDFEAGMYVGFGICFVGGIEFGIGVGASVGTLKITNAELTSRDVKIESNTGEEEPITEKKFDLDQR